MSQTPSTQSLLISHVSFVTKSNYTMPATSICTILHIHRACTEPHFPTPAAMRNVLICAWLFTETWIIIINDEPDGMYLEHARLGFNFDFFLNKNVMYHILYLCYLLWEQNYRLNAWFQFSFGRCSSGLVPLYFWWLFMGVGGVYRDLLLEPFFWVKYL